MSIQKTVLLLLLVAVGGCSAEKIAFDIINGIAVTFVSPLSYEDLFFSKDVQFDVYHGHMVNAGYFINRGLYPVGVVVHNTSNDPIKISGASVGGVEQLSVDTVLDKCCKDTVVANVNDMLNRRILVAYFALMASVTDIVHRTQRRGPSVPVSIWFTGLLGVGVVSVKVSQHLMGWETGYETKVNALRPHMLDAELVIRPGEKIIRYLWLARYENNIDRADFGILEGLQFSVFNIDNSVRARCKVRMNA